MMIRVYGASKLHHAAMWRGICEQSSSFFFHARWLKHNKLKTPDTLSNAVSFWLEDEEDVKNCDVLIVYAIEGDKLRGALIEAGMAIAYNKPVIVVGKHPDYGTWQYHPKVHRATDLKHALEIAQIEFAKGR